MRRLSLPIAAWWLLAITATALADDPAGTSPADASLASEPLLPYVVGLLVAAVTLAIVGVVVTVTRRDRRTGAGARGATAWWTCPACGASNAPGRPDCFACQAPRGADGTAPAAVSTPEAAPSAPEPASQPESPRGS
jgi:hypothetical protein